MKSFDTTPIEQELRLQLPPDANMDQSGVKEGYYRTRFNRIRSLSLKRQVRIRVVQRVDLDNKCLIGEKTYFVPKGEELVVRVDRFMDNATCPECRGRGHSEQTCPDCGGTRNYFVDSLGTRDKRVGSDKTQLTAVECSSCKASEVRNPYPRSTGKVPCVPCRGTGQRVGAAGIAVSDAHHAEPTTGVIMATGPMVKDFDRGQRIFFSQYAGIEYEYDGRKYCSIHQRYPLGIIVGEGEVHAKDAAQR